MLRPPITTRRLIPVWPTSAAELRAQIDRRHRILWPTTRALLEPDEAVLMDVRLPGVHGRMLLRARVQYSIPEGRGPLFVCARDDQPALDFLLFALEQPDPTVRAHSRYPVDLAATLTIDGETEGCAARMIDLSISGARLQPSEELPVGAKVTVEVTQHIETPFPHRLTGRIVASRKDGVAVHFAGPNFAEWRSVRRALRRVEETGVMPTLGA